MKRNVDLTENRVFSTRVIPDHLWLLTHNKYPWSVNNSPNSESYTNELVLCGDSITRKNKVECNNLSNGLMCVRCGKDLSKKPWTEHHLLCEECTDILEEESDDNRFVWS